MSWEVYSAQNGTTIAHYGVKGMKWGVRKEYVPHPRKGKRPKWEDEDLAWEPVSRSSKKQKAKNEKTKKRLNIKKIAKYTAIAAALAAVGYVSYKEYQKFSSGDESSITKKILASMGKQKLPDISSKPLADTIDKAKESTSEKVINLTEKVKELDKKSDSQPKVSDSDLNKLASQMKDLGFPVVKSTTERINTVNSLLASSHPESASFELMSKSKKFFLKNAWSKELWNSLTPDEQTGVVDYTGMDYIGINSTLRFGKATLVTSEKQAQINSTIPSITSALSKSITKEDFIVHRGVKFTNLPSILGVDMDELKDPKTLASLVGKRFVDKGFVSTGASADKSWDGAKLHINVPKGTQGMYVDTISKNSGENEFLLQRGTSFAIENLVFSPNGTITDIILSVVSQDPDKM